MAIKTSISFGLVYIPVKLQNVIKNNDISFNLLHKKYKSRIYYRRMCPECENDVPQEDIVKGYEYEDGKYVIFYDEDFEKIKSKKDKTVTIEKFIDIADIDPVYYQKAYYVQPAAGAEKAFNLLLKTLQNQGKVGIAKTVLGTKDNLVALRAKGDDMILSTMYFYEEVQANSYKANQIEVNQRELELAKAIVENMSGKFDITAYKDEYRQKILDAIEQKVSGKEIVTPKEKEGYHNVISLMDALEKSIEFSLKKERIEEKSKKKTKQKSVKGA